MGISSRCTLFIISIKRFHYVPKIAMSWRRPLLDSDVTQDQEHINQISIRVWREKDPGQSDWTFQAQNKVTWILLRLVCSPQWDLHRQTQMILRQKSIKLWCIPRLTVNLRLSNKKNAPHRGFWTNTLHRWPFLTNILPEIHLWHPWIQGFRDLQLHQLQKESQNIMLIPGLFALVKKKVKALLRKIWEARVRRGHIFLNWTLITAILSRNA